MSGTISEGQREAANRAVDALNRGDFGALLAEYSDDVEFTLHSPFPEPATHRGRAAVETLFSDLQSTLAGFHAVVTESRESGDRLFYLAEFRAKGAASGAATAQKVGWLFRFAGEKIARVDIYASWEDASEAFDHG